MCNYSVSQNFSLLFFTSRWHPRQGYYLTGKPVIADYTFHQEKEVLDVNFRIPSYSLLDLNNNYFL